MWLPPVLSKSFSHLLAQTSRYITITHICQIVRIIKNSSFQTHFTKQSIDSKTPYYCLEFSAHIYDDTSIETCDNAH